MGQSTDAMLMYGYHLGGEDGEWEIEEVGEYGELDADRIPWFTAADEDQDEDDEDGFVPQAEKHLLSEIGGFSETDWRADGYRDRERAAEKLVGVTFESHCSGDYPMYVLAAFEMTASRGTPKAVDMAALAQRATDEGWDAKLTAALQTLGITPKQAKPCWLLCSYWG